MPLVTNTLRADTHAHTCKHTHTHSHTHSHAQIPTHEQKKFQETRCTLDLNITTKLSSVCIYRIAGKFGRQNV